MKIGSYSNRPVFRLTAVSSRPVQEPGDDAGAHRGREPAAQSSHVARGRAPSLEGGRRRQESGGCEACGLALQPSSVGGRGTGHGRVHDCGASERLLEACAGGGNGEVLWRTRLQKLPPAAQEAQLERLL